VPELQPLKFTDSVNNIEFRVQGDTAPQEIIRLDSEGFHYRGQLIEDAGEAHRLMVEFLKQSTQSQPEPVAPTDEDLEDLAEVMNVSGNPVPAMRRALELWGNSQGILASSPQPEPVAPTEAASRVSHYLEQRRLIRGLDAEVINALHAGTDEPRQAALTVSDLEALARWGTPAINTRGSN
jgi:hypothetical protein